MDLNTQVKKSLEDRIKLLRKPIDRTVAYSEDELLAIWQKYHSEEDANQQ